MSSRLTGSPAPRLRIERVPAPSRWVIALITLLSFVLALLFGGIVLFLAGENPIQVYGSMFSGAFGDWNGVAETLVKTTPLLLAGLGVSVAFRMQLWNIGAEGQLYWGAIFATGLTLFVIPSAPGWVMVPAMIGAGLLGGGLWGLIPGALRAWFGASEIITTLMLNYVAILFVDYLVHGTWRDPGSSGFPLSKPFGESATLPVLVGETRLHAGFLIALAGAALLWVVLRNTRFGYEVRAIGESRPAARYAGMPTERNIVLVLLVSGGLAGLAGMGEVAGIVHRIQPDISVAYGYTGILVAALARFSPPGVVLVGVLFGALQVGGFSLQTAGAPASIVGILMGSILFVAIGAEFLARFRVGWRRAPEELAAEERRAIAHEVEAG